MPLNPEESSLSLSLRQWLELNLTRFLTNLDLPQDESWEMPVVEDFVLVVAAKDYKDGGVGVFSISPPDSSFHSQTRFKNSSSVAYQLLLLDYF